MIQFVFLDMSALSGLQEQFPSSQCYSHTFPGLHSIASISAECCTTAHVPDQTTLLSSRLALAQAGSQASVDGAGGSREGS